MQPMLRVKEAAQIANVSESTIRRMMAADEIRHKRMRGAIRIYADFLNDFENEIDLNSYKKSLINRQGGKGQRDLQV